MLLSVKKKLFRKNLAILLTALCLPVILLSLSTFYITQSNIKEELNKNNENILLQIKDNLEMIIDDTDSLNLTFSSNPEMINMLKQVLNNYPSNSNFTNYMSIINNLLISSVAARPYIYSIYIYSDNVNRSFMSSIDGLVTVDSFFDKSWYDSFERHQNDKTSFWNDSRTITRYSFEESKNVITFYKKFFNEQGLVVLNISKDYLEKKINGLYLFPNQVILVLDANNNIILKNKYDASIKDLRHLEIDKSKYYVTKINSDKYQWQYVSITPLSSLYTNPIKLGKILIVMLFISIVLCILLSLVITRRTYNNISTIITILDHAENGNLVPQMPHKVRDEYDIIIQNILRNYIDQNALKTELIEKHYKMRILELIALQAQINPHFLFNTLKAVFWMSFQLTGSKNEVSQMIENLSNILYYSISKEARLVAFEEEIQNTRNYIEIEQTRYKGKFDVIWEYPDHIGEFHTIKLLIQPFVENSILHGLMETEHKGAIKIKLTEQRDAIVLTITDNGIGIEKAALEQVNKKLQLKQDNTDHIGIYNCNRRLTLAFGERYGIRIRSKRGFGTSVKVLLPKTSADQANMHLAQTEMKSAAT